MYINFVAHNTEKSSSSLGVFQYLEKENEEEKLKNQYLILEGRGEEVNNNLEEFFFNQDFDISNQDNDPNGKINLYEASEQIDKNRGSQNLSSSNFYMINISPSQYELKHMENIAEQELERRGLKFENCQGNEIALEYYQEQKDQLMKAQMKIYTKDVMEMYARDMDREIYAYQDKLPNNTERKEMQPEIEDRFDKFLIDNGIKEREDNEYELVEFEKKVETGIIGGQTYVFQYNGKEEQMFFPNSKIKLVGENTLAIDKEYLNEKLEEKKDKELGIYNDDRIILKVQIDKEVQNSTQITLKPNGYDNEVKLWVNNKDFKVLDNGDFEINKYKADKLISKAIERDKEQKQLVKIDFVKVEEKDIKGTEDKMMTFHQKVKGLENPIKITFKRSELKYNGGEVFVENFKLKHRVEKAKDLAIKLELGGVKEDIKHKVWRENGFDPTKRKVEGKDLLYFAKVETERTYKHTDKSVIKNKPILKEIKELEQKGVPESDTRIIKLKNSLIRDEKTGEVIDEGVKKGGVHYHTHIVVSRHDRTSVNPRDKVSMSPMANHKEGVTNMGAKVGFNRDNFFKKAERIFDEKFEYERPIQEKYQYKNLVHKELKGKATGMIKGKIKEEIMKHTGMDSVRNELDVVRKAKQEIMPVPLPSSFPVSKIDFVFKIGNIIKNVLDKGIGY